MKWRGVHDDISRGPIPTLDYMKKQIRTLAAYKVNLFALYMEHVFDFQSQPLMAPKEAALTRDQIRELVCYAGKYYVTILPEQQVTSEINHFYWDAYEHLTDGDRVENDLEEIAAINARLEDLRDATTRLRGMYEKAWLRENRSYWLGNVLVRYDLLAQTFQSKIVAVRAAQRQYWMQKTLPPPQQLGFYLQP